MNTKRLRQIAILVDSLDTAAADRLLDSLPVELQQQVRDAVMDLEQVTDSERQYVLNEFRRGRGGSGSAAGGSSTPATSYPAAASIDRGRGSGGDMGSSTSGPPNSPTYRPARGPAPRSNPVPNSWPTGLPESESGTPTPGVDWSASAQWSPAADTPHGTGSPVRVAQPSGGTAVAAPLDLADTLAAVDLDALAAVVLRESPPVLAAILSLLPPLKAAQLLELCPPELQHAALQRLQHLTELDDDVVGFLQQALQTVIRQRQRLRQCQRVGNDALTDILVAAQRLRSSAVSQAIQSQLLGRQPNPEAADSRPAHTPPAPLRTPPPSIERPPMRPGFLASPDVRKATDATVTPATAATETSAGSAAGPTNRAANEQRLFSPELEGADALSDHAPRLEFTELVRCDNGSLQALLATAKPQLTLLALRGAEPALVERVLRMLPRGEAQEVRFRIQNIGPTRIQDIQQAQQYLLRLASLLEDLGRFRRPKAAARWRAAA